MVNRKNPLRSLSRLELMELLAKQEREIEALRKTVDELENKLNDRRIVAETSGSLAEAALRLSGIFEAADRAAELYKAGVREQLRQNTDSEGREPGWEEKTDISR